VGRELGALEPPAGDRAKIEAIVEGIKDGVTVSMQAPAKALKTPTPFAGVDRLMKAYGFRVCGRG
jgi:hypothetical protein